MQTSQSARWADLVLGFGREFVDVAAAFLPRALGAVALVLLGWVLGKLARRLVTKIASWARIPTIARESGLSDSLERVGLRGGAASLVGNFVYLVVFLLFVSAASDVVGWTAISETLRQLMMYLPNLLAGGLILAIAVIVSRPVEAFATTVLSELDVPFHAGVATLVKGLILLAGTFVALRQIGIDTRFLDSNVYLVVAGAVLVVALPLALGTRPVVANLVSGFYTRRLYRAGQQVCLGRRQAVVKSINEVSVVFESEDGDIHVPHSQLISKGYQA